MTTCIITIMQVIKQPGYKQIKVGLTYFHYHNLVEPKKYIAKTPKKHRKQYTLRVFSPSASTPPGAVVLTVRRVCRQWALSSPCVCVGSGPSVRRVCVSAVGPQFAVCVCVGSGPSVRGVCVCVGSGPSVRRVCVCVGSGPSVRRVCVSAVGPQFAVCVCVGSGPSVRRVCVCRQWALSSPCVCRQWALSSPCVCVSAVGPQFAVCVCRQ